MKFQMVKPYVRIAIIKYTGKTIKVRCTIARIRYIKPDFFEDADLAKLPPLYRIAFAGLWCQADKDGRLKDRAEELKVKILPYDNIDFNEILNKLSLPKRNNSPFVTRYKVNNENYIQINKFKEHQRPHHTEKDSLIPPIPLTVKRRLNTRSLTPSMEMEKGMEKGMEKESVHSETESPNSFERFWTAYPKKKSKGKAEIAFKKINPSEQLLATMLAKIEQAKTSEDWTKEGGKYIPYPATWLNAKGWEDEETEVARGHQPVSKFSAGPLQWLQKKEIQKKEVLNDGQG